MRTSKPATPSIAERRPSFVQRIRNMQMDSARRAGESALSSAGLCRRSSKSTVSAKEADTTESTARNLAAATAATALATTAAQQRLAHC